MIKERLRLLRAQMQKENIQAYIIPTSDFHETEYVSDYFACRKYMSGFTGSAGVLVVTVSKAALWTDGRYFIQAERQLKDSTIELMKMGQEGTPDIPDYILSQLQAGDTVGFDGRVINAADARRYDSAFCAQEIHLKTDVDLVGRIWTDRPALPHSKTFHYDEKYTGETIGEKLARVRQAMAEQHAVSHIATKIDEVAWLLNLRADDIPCFPVALAYAIIRQDDAVLYIDDSRLDPVSRQLMKENHIRIKGYFDIYEDVKTLTGPVLYDPSFVNSRLIFSLQAPAVEAPDPELLMKAVKNETEIAATKNAHLKDGAAVVKFMYWLHVNVPQGTVSEWSAQQKLTALRSEQDGYIEDSFTTISAYKDHAAMMHYSSSPETDVLLKPEGLYLVDSGGQYIDGTTDITRTFVLGPITKEEKYWFTLAMRSHIRLAAAHWLYGCSGLNLDILARGPLWDQDMDYQCGTGHGIGHLSTVHEAPNGFRWRKVPERNDSAVLEAGMIQSDEPGVYMEGKFGIRHENEVLVVKGNKNFYGQFMHLEPLTFVPFDVKGIDPSLMTEEEINWLNNYHAAVVKKISPYLTDEEASWLKQICQPIRK
ncbi:aminopeptidase P family protein [Catenisphaera adipataccumulans]|uniref:Xaa-Pro aminopeptidase n=1 Tax=Catenisphaera adipataccumulans TaxID=700500 RepID=A0A7W8CYR9_9FIRM|nr:aminopeptidase P family protein [Catenisphaera adipataccumulans]MBB5182854.1 Xaa-Pro aminopeptidase [Catenisphaera adipataccumulans]